MRYTWDGIEDPFSCFIRDAREKAGHLQIGMSSWGGMGWKFMVYTGGKLEYVRPGDTVVLEDDGTITLTRGTNEATADHGES